MSSLTIIEHLKDWPQKDTLLGRDCIIRNIFQNMWSVRVKSNYFMQLWHSTRNLELDPCFVSDVKRTVVTAIMRSKVA